VAQLNKFLERGASHPKLRKIDWACTRFYCESLRGATGQFFLVLQKGN
jgi:hypothetical protein